MKSFLEEYGFAILAAIVVILLIAMTTPVGSLIKSQITGVIESFAGKTEAKLAALDTTETVVKLVQKDNEGNFTIKVESQSSTDVFKAEYRVKDQNGNWNGWKALKELDTGSKTHSLDFKAAIENNNKIQVRVYDEAKDKNVYFESNIVEYSGTASSEAPAVKTAYINKDGHYSAGKVTKGGDNKLSIEFTVGQKWEDVISSYSNLKNSGGTIRFRDAEYDVEFTIYKVVTETAKKVTSSVDVKATDAIEDDATYFIIANNPE